jgi:hypothetical protein
MEYKTVFEKKSELFEEEIQCLQGKVLSNGNEKFWNFL